MSLILIICIILIAFALLALEILVLPGTTVAGILGIGGLCFAVYSAFTSMGTLAGWIVLASVLVSSVLFLIIILRSKTWEKLKLNASIDAKVNTLESSVEEGEEGISISRLAPMGTIELKGEYYEAQSLLNFIEPQKKVRVVKVDGNKIWVEEIK